MSSKGNSPLCQMLWKDSYVKHEKYFHWIEQSRVVMCDLGRERFKEHKKTK